MLREYQKQGVLFLRARKEAALCDEPGTGKTITAVCACAEEGLTALVVCPASIRYEWKQEIAKWTDLRCVVIDGPPKARQLLYLLKAPFYIVSYDVVLRDFETINKLPFNCIILDEAQRIRNAKTITAQTVKRLRHCERRYVLTATPIENHINDLYSLIEFLNGDIYNCIQKELLAGRGSYSGYYNTSWGEGAKRLRRMVTRAPPEALHRALGQYMLRRRKEDVEPELPPKTSIIIETPLTPEQDRLYQTARDELILLIGDTAVPIVNILSKFTYLREICNSTGLIDPKKPHHSSKMDELIPRVLDITQSGNKVIIFSEFKRMCDLIVAALRERGLGVSYLHGQTRDAEAQKKAFWDKNEVMVATRTGEAGHNLQCGTYCFNYEVPWNPARLRQREDRIHRIGQDKPVIVYTMLAPNTVEKRISEVLLEKNGIFTQIIERPEYREWLRSLVQ